MSPMEQLAKQEYERGYSDGKSDFFAAGVAEGEMRARQRMIANRVAANQHPFAASGKPIDHITDTGKVIAEPVKQEQGCEHMELIGYLLDGEFYKKMQFHREGGAYENQTPLYAAPVDAKAIGLAIHYPDCWDTAAYPTLDSALAEIAAWGNPFRCTNDDCVDAKAIRAEALEEAAKVCEEIMEYGEYPDCEAEQCAAAIRGMK